MAEYKRQSPASPTEEEIKIGYAPSTISGTPFIKFLFWTFAGLAITFAIAYGTFIALDAVEKNEQARYERLATRKPLPAKDYQLQPSVHHQSLDWEDTENLYKDYAAQLKAKKWDDDPKRPGKVTISQDTVNRTQAAMKKWAQ